ncbi:MAG: OmpA family protein, partial [bacterium]
PILTAEPKPVSPSPRIVASQPKPIAPAVKPAAAAWPTLEGGHWKTTSTSREMKVVFDDGLFTKNTELSDGAKQDLKAVATALKGKGFKIEVEGHTDPSKATGKTAAANNKSLGLARARTASSYLTKQCGWPTGAITLSSDGDANPPHPNTTAESRKKNRTVVLKITALTARQP